MRNPTLQDARKDSETDGDWEEVVTLRSPTLQDAQKEVYTSRVTLRSPTLPAREWIPDAVYLTARGKPTSSLKFRV